MKLEKSPLNDLDNIKLYHRENELKTIKEMYSNRKNRIKYLLNNGKKQNSIFEWINTEFLKMEQSEETFSNFNNLKQNFYKLRINTNIKIQNEGKTRENK